MDPYIRSCANTLQTECVESCQVD